MVLKSEYFNMALHILAHTLAEIKINANRMQRDVSVLPSFVSCCVYLKLNLKRILSLCQEA